MKKRIGFSLLSVFLCLCLLLPLSSCGGAGSAETFDTAGEGEGTDTGTEDVSAGAETDVPEDPNSPAALFAKLTPHKGRRIRIACVGDSITYGSGASNPSVCSYPARLDKLFGGNCVIGNFGRPGAYAMEVENPYNAKKAHPELYYRNTQEYRDSLTFDADAVLIMLGTNDARSLTVPAAHAEFKKALRSLAREYAELPGVQQVYILTCIRTANTAIIEQTTSGVLQSIQREAASELGLPVIDVFERTKDYYDATLHYSTDRLHPNDDTYAGLAKAVYKTLTNDPVCEYATAPASKTGVVYLSDSGNNQKDGSSPDKAVADLGVAVGLLRETGGTVVLCGPCTVKTELHLPANRKPVTVTAKDGGTDYTSSGAKLVLSHILYLYGDTVFEHLTLESGIDNSFINCNYRNVTFGDGIVSALASGVTSYPLIVAGYNATLDGVPEENYSLHGECRITVNSGSWAYIRCGNRRGSAAYGVGTVDKDALLDVTVNGGVFTNSAGANLTAATGMNSVAGKCVLTINGGEFKGPVYGVGRVGANGTSRTARVTGEVELHINGGSFASSIKGVQDNTTEVTGSVTLCLGKNAASLASKADGFTKVITE